MLPRTGRALVTSSLFVVLGMTAVIGCRHLDGFKPTGRSPWAVPPDDQTVRKVPADETTKPPDSKTPRQAPPQKTGPVFPKGSDAPVRLSLSVEAPTEAQLGGFVTFRAVVRNIGTVPAEDVTLETDFDDGLKFPGHEQRALRQALKALPAGETETVLLRLTAVKTGTPTATFSLKIAGREAVWKSVRVTVAPVQSKVTVIVPPLRTVGSRVEVTVAAGNVSQNDLNGVTVSLEFNPKTFKPDGGSQGMKVSAGRLTWNVQKLKAAEEIQLQAELECLAASEQACLQVKLAAENGPPAERLQCLKIVEAARPFDMRIADRDDLISVGGETDVIVSVQNRSGKQATIPALIVEIPKNFEVQSTSVWEGKQALAMKATIADGKVTFKELAAVAADGVVTYRIRVKAVKAGQAEFIARLPVDPKKPLELREPVTVNAKIED